MIAVKNLIYCTNHQPIWKKLFVRIANQKTARSFFHHSALQLGAHQITKAARHVPKVVVACRPMAADVPMVCAA
jgi:hypothetical protein